jgi:hypothetical protein
MDLSLKPTSTSTSDEITRALPTAERSTTAPATRASARDAGVHLAQASFNLNNAAEVLISSLSQNGGEVEGLQILSKDTQQDLTRIYNQTETDTFVAKFQGTPITISIEKDLINTAYGSKENGSNYEKIGIPNKVTISSESHGSIAITSQELGGETQDPYIGEGKLNLINFNLNKLVPKETK